MTENISNPMPPKQRICTQHGPYTAEHLFAGIFEPCPTCMAENEVARKAAEADEPVYDLKATRRLVAGIVKRFENATFETFVAENERQRRVLEVVQGYAVHFREHFKEGRCMVMLGRPGTGKTHLGCAILRHCMDASDKFTGKLVSVYELFRQIKASWDRGSKITEREAIAKFVKPHLLIIDEVGVQFDSPTEQGLLFDVINERYQAVLPTVVISNLSENEFIEVVGGRSSDRLRENGSMIVPFTWESHRGR
jgi:DNA replication protein DnaC